MKHPVTKPETLVTDDDKEDAIDGDRKSPIIEVGIDTRRFSE